MAQTTETPTRDTSLLRRRDQGAVAVLTLMALVAMAWQWMVAEGPAGRLTEVEGRSQRTVQCYINVNTASWPELTLLPRIAKTMSQRMIESRDAEGPFRNANDLARVHRIGPKTVARMKPYLAPFDTPAADAPR